jgi:hypothetical protein
MPRGPPLSTVATTEQQHSAHGTAKDLIADDQLWDRLIQRIIREHGVDQTRAEAIMRETLNFLLLAADRPLERFAPSGLVDIGWHTFLMYTKEYAAFCSRVAGSFIHHAPNDDPEQAGSDFDVRKTVAALRAAGYLIDDRIWIGESDCSTKCYSGDCSNTR